MAFEYIIDPITKDQFFKRYFEHDILYIPREKQPHYFDAIISIADINQYLRREDFGSHPYKVIKKGKRKFYSAKDNISLVSNILKDFDENGHTLVLNQVRRYVSKLGDYINKLNLEYPIGFGSNIYITPPNSQGLSIHHDAHDVFILQLYGNKNWHIYENTKSTKLPRNNSASIEESEMNLSHQFNVKAGDTLYIPRGMRHLASTSANPSVHISMGINRPIRGKEILESLGELFLNEKSMNDSIFHLSEDELKVYEDRFKEILTRGLQEICLSDIINRVGNQNRQLLTGYRSGPGLSNILNSYQEVNDDTILILNTNRIIYYIKESPFLILHIDIKRYSFPLFLNSLFEKMLAQKKLSIAQIQDIVGTHKDSTNELIRKLLRIGFCKIG